MPKFKGVVVNGKVQYVKVDVKEKTKKGNFDTAKYMGSQLTGGIKFFEKSESITKTGNKQASQLIVVVIPPIEKFIVDDEKWDYAKPLFANRDLEHWENDEANNYIRDLSLVNENYTSEMTSKDYIQGASVVYCGDGEEPKLVPIKDFFVENVCLMMPSAKDYLLRIEQDGSGYLVPKSTSAMKEGTR